MFEDNGRLLLYKCLQVYIDRAINCYDGRVLNGFLNMLISTDWKSSGKLLVSQSSRDILLPA